MRSDEHKIYNITLALAGIFQAASLVRDLAKKGTLDEEAYAASISSVYKVDAANATAVYGGTQNLRIGLTELIRLLGHDKTSTDPYIGRYVVSLIQVERKLVKNKNIMQILTRRVKYASSQAVYFSETHSTVIASLADIYLNTVGTLNFRIQVIGQAKFLSQTEIVNKVRALLLAGIRSVVLWRQLGGSRFNLLFSRNKITQSAKNILSQL